jgi:hypoxanthine-DNA glycosylase
MTDEQNTAPPIETAFPALANKQAHILILGSMPGLKSLKDNQYYAHPRNAFWSIMSSLYSIDCQLDYQRRCHQLVQHKIAVWDVLHACQRPGSLDQHIVSDTIITNDFELFFQQHSLIKKICFNGSKAQQLYLKHVLPRLSQSYQSIERILLPSTSPAHARMTMEQKYLHWQKALQPTL